MASILNKIFGTTSSFSKFYEKVGETKQKVTISVGRYPCIHTDVETYFIEFDAPNAHFTIDNFAVSRLDPSYKEKKSMLERTVVQQAKSYHNLFLQTGLESKIVDSNGESLAHYCPTANQYPKSATA